METGGGGPSNNEKATKCRTENDDTKTQQVNVGNMKGRKIDKL